MNVIDLAIPNPVSGSTPDLSWFGGINYQTLLNYILGGGIVLLLILLAFAWIKRSGARDDNRPGEEAAANKTIGRIAIGIAGLVLFGTITNVLFTVIG